MSHERAITEERTTAEWLLSPPTEPRRFLSELASKTKWDYAKILVEGPENDKKEVPSDDIFVPTPLIPLKSAAPGQIGGRTSTRIPYKQLPILYHRAVILGDPGGGKSTLARMLCRDILSSCVEGTGPLAIRLELRKYEAEARQDAHLHMFDYLVSVLAKSTNLNWEELKKPIRYFLGLGLVTVVFDGLDEILEVARRRDMVKVIESFYNAFPLCPTYVTSRSVGYDRAPLDDDVFAKLDLNKFSEIEAHSYFMKCSQAAFRKTPAEAETSKTTFFKSISEGSELTRNPLMLGLMVWIFYVRRGELPHDRATLYRECSLLMFQRWDRLREINPEMPDDFDLMDLLAHLASQMFLDPDLGAGVSKEWLENEAKRFFWAIYNQDARNRAARAAREVIEFVTGRSWIMTGSGLFSFSHRTFLEYFFAKHLHNETKDPAELAARLCDRIANGEWHVSAHLAIQLVIASRTKMATMVGDSVAEQLGVYLRDNPSFRSDILAFLMDFLEYLAASENTIEKIARMVGCYGTLMPISRDLFTRMLNTINPRRLAVYVGITEGVCDCVRMCEAEPTALARVLDWIYELSLAVYGQTQEGSRDAEFIKVWRNCAPQVFREKSGAAFAKWLFDCSGEVNENMLQYGLALWTAERPFYERTTFLGTDFILMASELQRYVKFGVPIDQLPYANLAVAIAPELRNQAPIRLPKDSRCFNLQLSGPINWSSLFNVELDKKGFACIVIALLCYELSARTEFREIITERERQEIRGCIPLLDRFLEHAPLNDETRFLQLYRQTRLSLLV